MNEFFDGFGPHSGPVQQPTQNESQPQQSTQQQQQGDFCAPVKDELDVLKNISLSANQRYWECGCPITRPCSCY